MIVTYSFVADWSFYRTALARYPRQKPNRYRRIAVVTIIGAALLLVWAYCHFSGALWTHIVEKALVGGGAGGTAAYALARIFRPWSIKRSPNYGATITVTLDDNGLRAVEPHAQVSLDWKAFTRVSRFADGFLFVRGRLVRWLPDSALTNATPEDALAFVRSKTEVAIIG